jgi:hypothetical protein
MTRLDPPSMCFYFNTSIVFDSYYRLNRPGTMKKFALTYYRKLCKALDESRSGHFFYKDLDRARMSNIVRQNRHALDQVTDWLPSGLIAQSVFRYGVNKDVEPLINLPLDNDYTHADLLAYFGSGRARPCKYLELGVSVGKTFWQVLNTCSPCECWGFDIEEISPVLKKNLVEKSRTEWAPKPGSIKKTPSSITHFIHQPTGNKIVYICADIFDEAAWQLLERQSFNLVLSDALHTPQALDFELQQMAGFKIFDPKETVILWDDLDGQMKDWFFAQRTAIAKLLAVGVNDVNTLYLNGWLGSREFPHRLGLAIRRPASC